MGMDKGGARPGGGRPTVYAVITLEDAEHRVDPGDAVMFTVRGRDEQEELSLGLARILGASTHDLGNGSFIVVAH